jgi:UDP-glucose/iron transport system permease protein
MAMRTSFLNITPALGAVMVTLVLLATAIAAAGRLGLGMRFVRAAVRGTLQLAAVAVVITAVVRSLWSTLLFMLVMAGVAGVTSARRVGGGAGWLLLPITAGGFPLVIVALAVGILPARGLAIIPVTGILLGGAMTATSLAGRRAADEMRARRGEIEAALAIGLDDRSAALEIIRPSAAQALGPALDQTRTVGLVTLPGAFVGMLLAGASPLAAAAVQLFVLVALLAVEALAVVLTVELVARGRAGHAAREAARGQSGRWSQWVRWRWRRPRRQGGGGAHPG